MSYLGLIALKKEFTQADNYFNDADIVNPKFDESNMPLFNKLFIDDSNYKIISSSPKAFSAIHKDDFTENFHISDKEFDAYIIGFVESIRANIAEVIEKAVESGAEDDLNKAALDDADVKLSLYRSFKSLYDKWI